MIVDGVLCGCIGLLINIISALPQGSAKLRPYSLFSIGGLPIYVSTIQLTIVFRIEMGSKQLCIAKLV